MYTNGGPRSWQGEGHKQVKLGTTNSLVYCYIGEVANNHLLEVFQG